MCVVPAGSVPLMFTQLPPVEPEMPPPWTLKPLWSVAGSRERLRITGVYVEPPFVEASMNA